MYIKVYIHIYIYICIHVPPMEARLQSTHRSPDLVSCGLRPKFVLPGIGRNRFPARWRCQPVLRCRFKSTDPGAGVRIVCPLDWLQLVHTYTFMMYIYTYIYIHMYMYIRTRPKLSHLDSGAYSKPCTWPQVCQGFSCLLARRFFQWCPHFPCVSGAFLLQQIRKENLTLLVENAFFPRLCFILLVS